MNRTVRSVLLTSLVGAVMYPATICRGQTGVELRNAWRYTMNSAFGYFVSIGEGVWIEQVPGGPKYQFIESSRDQLSVVLRDGSRGIEIKLETSSCFWKYQSDSTWNPLYAGSWVDRKLLPPGVSGRYRIRPIYFLPTDRHPTANYEAKIRTINHFIAKYFRDTFADAAIPSDGPRFEINPITGIETVHMIRGRHPASHYSGSPNYDINQQWRTISAEIFEQFGSPEEVLYLVFAETYDAGPSPFEWPGAVAVGGRTSTTGGFAICSSWILRDEFCATSVDGQLLKFSDSTPVVGRSAIGHGGPNSPRFEFVEDGFGAAIHEVGHAIGMIHDHRNGNYDLMGNGFRNLRHNFILSADGSQKCVTAIENLRIAAASRFINSAPNLGDNAPPFSAIKWSVTPRRGDKTVSLRVNLADSGALRWITYFQVGSDSVITGRALSGGRRTFVETLRIGPLRRGTIELRAFVGDSGGNVSIIPIRGVVR